MQPKSIFNAEEVYVATASSAGRPIERRSHCRYPITLRVEYKVKRNQPEQRGSGRTRNVSSGGVLFDADDFEADQSFPIGSTIELTIRWPFIPDAVCPIKLLVKGRIIRTASKGVAVRTSYHQFSRAEAGASEIHSPAET
jgi:hypothetical protein